MTFMRKSDSKGSDINGGYPIGFFPYVYLVYLRLWNNFWTSYIYTVVPAGVSDHDLIACVSKVNVKYESETRR